MHDDISVSCVIDFCDQYARARARYGVLGHDHSDRLFRHDICPINSALPAPGPAKMRRKDSGRRFLPSPS